MNTNTTDSATYPSPSPATTGLTATDLTGSAGIAGYTNISTPTTSDNGHYSVTITGLTGANGDLILNLVNTTDLTPPTNIHSRSSANLHATGPPTAFAVTAATTTSRAAAA